MKAGRSVWTVVVLVLVLSACIYEPTMPRSEHPITASIDGHAWSANLDGEAPLAQIQQVYDGARLHILGRETARDSAAREIEIIVAGFSGPGTYHLGAPESGRWAFYKRRPKPILEPVTYMTTDIQGGTITVTSVDEVRHVIEGSFSFTARMPSGAEVTVGQGWFSGSYRSP